MPLPQPPAELCDPMKGRSRVSTLSSSPRAKLCSAELDGGQLPDWRLAAAPSRSSSPVSLSLFLCLFYFFILTLSLSHSTSLSLYPCSPSLSSVSLTFSSAPPPSVPHCSHCSLCFRAAWQPSPGLL